MSQRRDASEENEVVVWRSQMILENPPHSGLRNEKDRVLQACKLNLSLVVNRKCLAVLYQRSGIF